MDKQTSLNEIEEIFESYSFEKIYAFKEYGQGKIYLMEAALKGPRKQFIAQIISPEFRIKALARNLKI